jgi:hypothetical protein
MILMTESISIQTIIEMLDKFCQMLLKDNNENSKLLK